MVPDGRTCLALVPLSVDILRSFGSRPNDARPGLTRYRPAAISRTPIFLSRNALLDLPRGIEAVSWPGPIQGSEALLHGIPLGVAFEQTRRMLLVIYQNEKFTFLFQQNSYLGLAQAVTSMASTGLGIYSAIGRLAQRRW
jgi:hypothetical protein